MSLISVLCLRLPENAARAIEAGAGDLAIQAMERFPAAQQMQRNSCLMIRNLVVRNPENRRVLQLIFSKFKYRISVPLYCYFFIDEIKHLLFNQFFPLVSALLKILGMLWFMPSLVKHNFWNLTFQRAEHFYSIMTLTSS